MCKIEDKHSFKAKRIDNGEWVYGSYFKWKLGREISHHILIDGLIQNYGSYLAEISPEIDYTTLERHPVEIEKIETDIGIKLSTTLEMNNALLERIYENRKKINEIIDSLN